MSTSKSSGNRQWNSRKCGDTTNTAGVVPTTLESVMIQPIIPGVVPTSICKRDNGFNSRVPIHFVINEIYNQFSAKTRHISTTASERATILKYRIRELWSRRRETSHSSRFPKLFYCKCLWFFSWNIWRQGHVFHPFDRSHGDGDIIHDAEWWYGDDTIIIRQ